MMFAALGVWLLLAQAAPKLTPPNQIPDVQRLIGIATGLRAEYSADILLRLIEAGKIPDRELKFELLERVFQAAPQVGASFRLTDVVSKSDTFTRRVSEAHRQRLDTLSIQLRVVEALLKDDPRKARETFAKIPPMSLPRASCEQPMAPDVSQFYVVLGALFDGTDITFLRNRIAQVNSVPQLVPVFDLLETLTLPTTAFDDLMNVLATQLTKMTGTNREWYAGTIEDWVERIIRIEVRRRQRQVSLSAAWRGLGLYSRCSESLVKTEPVEIPPRLADLMRPLYSSRDPRYEKISGVGPEAWEISATRFLDELAGFRASNDADETRVFEIKSTLYLTAIDNLPESTQLDRARVDHLQFLRLNVLQSKSPIQWLVPLKALLRTMRESGGAPMLESMKTVNDPVIAAYALLESIAPK